MDAVDSEMHVLMLIDLSIAERPMDRRSLKDFVLLKDFATSE